MMVEEKNPTLFAAVPIFNYLINKLEDKEDEDFTQAEKKAISATLDKLKYYYYQINSTVYTACTSKYILKHILF